MSPNERTGILRHIERVLGRGGTGSERSGGGSGRSEKQTKTYNHKKEEQKQSNRQTRNKQNDDTNRETDGGEDRQKGEGRHTRLQKDSGLADIDRQTDRSIQQQ